jgi:CubicO group peptidase (beta-lactamase class C family)
MNHRFLATNGRTLVLLSIISASCGSPDREVADGTLMTHDLSGIITPLLEKSQLPALGAAVVTSDGLEAIGAVGVRSWTEPVKVGVDDQWHIGSCTKSMTALLVARLIDRGVLSWATTMGEVFGPTIDTAWKDVSIVWLLSHRSGAPLNFSEDLWEEMVHRGGYPREQRRYFVEHALKTAPTTTPNTETIYSNSGFIVVGVMLEILTDSSWEDLMRREVFGPLGMDRTGFGAPGTSGKLDQPLGHIRSENGWQPISLGPNADNPAATGPAGSIHTTLSDWALFIAAHLRGARGDQRFLSTTTWDRLHSSAGSDWEYSPGWVVDDEAWAGGKVLRHIGSNGFWLAQATVAPKKDLAVLIVTNVADDVVETPFKELLSALIADHEARAR